MNFESSRPTKEAEKSPLKRPETEPRGFELKKEEFLQAEKTLLERISNSRLRNAILACTSFAALMAASPTFGGERKDISASASPYEETVKMLPEFSVEDLIIKKELWDFLAKEGIAEKGREELFRFSRERRIPLADLRQALTHRQLKSDPLMIMSAYAVAYDAVWNNSLDANHREYFREFILPNLKNGVLNVVKGKWDKVTAASYNTETDTYTDTEIDLLDLKDRGRTIHELVHACQDGAKLIQKREDSEFEAYTIQAEYVLRQQKKITENNNGTFTLGSVDIDKLSSNEKVVMLEKVKVNLEKRRNDLNTVSFGDINLTNLGEKNITEDDMLEYVKQDLRSSIASAKTAWKFSTNLGVLSGGKLIDVEQMLEKDGFKRLSNETTR